MKPSESQCFCAKTQRSTSAGRLVMSSQIVSCTERQREQWAARHRRAEGGLAGWVHLQLLQPTEGVATYLSWRRCPAWWLRNGAAAGNCAEGQQEGQHPMSGRHGAERTPQAHSAAHPCEYFYDHAR